MMEEEILARLIRLRRYKELEETTNKLLHEHGWSEVLRRIENIPTPSLPPYDIRSRKDFQNRIRLSGEPIYVTEDFLGLYLKFYPLDRVGWGVRPGTLRDGIINLLGLGRVNGIDIADLSPLEVIQASSLDDLRNAIIPVAKGILRKQISKNKTFFIDVDDMLMSPFGGLIPEVIESRASEVQDLGPNSHPNHVAKTYYGFQLFTQGSLEQYTKGVRVHEEAIAAFEALAKTLGGSSSLKHSKFNFKDNPWVRYEKLTHRLLMGIMTVSIGGTKDRALEGVQTLRLLGDSRAIPVLHRVYERFKGREKRLHVLQAIEATGDPRSFNVIRPHAEKTTKFSDEVLAALPSLRCRDAIEYVVSVASGSNKRKNRVAIENLWKTFDTNAIDILEKCYRENVEEDHKTTAFERSSFYKSKKMLAALSLGLIGPDGWEVLHRNPAELADLLLSAGNVSELVHVLKAVSGIMDHKLIIDSVAQRLRWDHRLVDLLSAEPSVSAPDPFVDAILEGHDIEEKFHSLLDWGELMEHSKFKEAALSHREFISEWISALGRAGSSVWPQGDRPEGRVVLLKSYSYLCEDPVIQKGLGNIITNFRDLIFGAGYYGVSHPLEVLSDMPEVLLSPPVTEAVLNGLRKSSTSASLAQIIFDSKRGRSPLAEKEEIRMALYDGIRLSEYQADDLIQLLISEEDIRDDALLAEAIKDRLEREVEESELWKWLDRNRKLFQSIPKVQAIIEEYVSKE